MTTYRVDLANPGAWSTRDGSDWTGNQYLGLSGLQYLIDTITAGNTVHIKGTGAGSKLKTIASTTSLSGAFVRGEGVTWDAGSSTGVVSEVSADAPTVIEVTAGTLANPDSLVGVTSGATCTVNGAIAQKAQVIDVDTNSGTNTDGFIEYIGVNSSGSNDGTRCIIDGEDVATNCMRFTAVTNILWWENIAVKQATGDGVERSATTSTNNYWLNCAFHDNGGSGFDCGTLLNHRFILCAFYNNTGSGLLGANAAFVRFCSFHDNSAHGISAGGYAQYIFDSLIYDNTDDGINNMVQSILWGLTINGNGDEGVNTGSGTSSNLVLGCRITNHEEGASPIGYDAGSRPVVLGWNYFEDNSGDNVQDAGVAKRILVGGVDTNLEDQADTDEGYTSKTDGYEDFNLESDATLRRTAITIPTS